MAAFAQAMDTHDYRPYVVGFGNLLASGDTLASVTSIVVPASATAAGFSVDTTTNPPAIQADPEGVAGRDVVFWPMVETANEEDAAWDGTGITVKLGIRVTTTNGWALERHVDLTVKKEVG